MGYILEYILAKVIKTEDVVFSFTSFVMNHLLEKNGKSRILFIKRDTCAAGAHMIKEMGIHQIRQDLIHSLQ